MYVQTKYHPDQPAFPLTNDKGAVAYLPDGEPVSAQGLMLKAHLAGEAMKSLILECGGNGSVEDAAKELGITWQEYDYRKHWPKLVAKRAVVFADALIEELNKS